MRAIPMIIVLVYLALHGTGCAQTGVMASAHLTEVQLSQDNFRVGVTDVIEFTE